MLLCINFHHNMPNTITMHAYVSFLFDKPLQYTSVFSFTVWYHILQGLSLFGWSGMVISLILLTSKKFDTSIPNTWRYHKQMTVSVLCIVSGK